MKKYKVLDLDQNELKLKCTNPKIISKDNVSRSLDQFVQQVGAIELIPVDPELQTTPQHSPISLMATTSSGSNTINAGSVNGTDIIISSDLFEGTPELDIKSAIYFNTFNDLITYGGELLSSGNVAITKGFYKPNDGGGSTYYIRTSLNHRINQYSQENLIKSGGYYVYSSPLIDGVTLINLGTSDSPLYADMQIEEGSFVNIRQVGGRPLEDGEKVNNQIYLQKALTFVKRKKFFRGVYIPSGHWCFSDKDSNDEYWEVQHPVSTGIGRVGIKIFGCGPSTVCMPYNDSQYYIFRVGQWYKKPALKASRGLEVSNLCFQCGKEGLSPKIAQLYGNDKEVTSAALQLVGCFYSSFLNLTFKYIYNTALSVENDFESHFSYLKFHCCGGVKSSGTVYPVIQLDRSSRSYASSVSANWFRVCHFDSCVGPLIYGGAKNCTHNEFNAVLVTGNASEYNRACPDANANDEAPSYSEVTNTWGVIDNFQGMTNFWPNLYNCVMCETFDNWAIRGDKKYRLYSVLNHTAANHCHVQLGIVSLKLGTGTNSGPWVANIRNTQISSSVLQLFWPEKWPYRVVKEEDPFGYPIPRCQAIQRDNRLVYAALSTDASVKNLSSSETPYHLSTVAMSSGSQTQFLARAGRRYGLKVYASEKFDIYGSTSVSVGKDYWFSATMSGVSGGLSIDNSGYKIVGHAVATDSYLLGSNGNWRFITLKGCFPLNNDCKVRLSGRNIDFIYEASKYPINTIIATLTGNSLTGSKNSTTTYQLSCSNSEVVSYTAVTANTPYLSVSVSGNILTCTTEDRNTSGGYNYSAVLITGKNSSGKNIERTTILVPQSPIIMTLPKSIILEKGDTYQLAPTFTPSGTYSVTWSAKDSVSVSSSGLVTANESGNGTVTASIKNSRNITLSTSCSVVVPNTDDALAYQRFTSAGGVINVNLQQGTLYRIIVYGDSSSKKILATTNSDAGILLSGKTSYYIPSQNVSSINISPIDSLDSIAVIIKNSTSERIANPVSSTIKGNFTVWTSGSTQYLLDTNGVIYKSTTLTSWSSYSNLSSDLLTRLKKSANGSQSGYSIKSVNVKKVGDYYNLYTSSSNSSGNSWIGVSRSTSITGPFEFVGSISEGLYPAIRVTDEGVYMIYGSGDLKITKLTEDGLTIDEESVSIISNIPELRCGLILVYKDNYYIFANTPSNIYVYMVTELENLLDGSESLSEPTNPVLSGISGGLTNPTFGNNIVSTHLLFMTDQGLTVQPINWTESTNEFDDTEWWPVFKNTAGVSGQISQSITKPIS